LKYAAMTKDEAQRRRWTFYEAVKILDKRRDWSPLLTMLHEDEYHSPCAELTASTVNSLRFSGNSSKMTMKGTAA